MLSWNKAAEVSGGSEGFAHRSTADCLRAYVLLFTGWSHISLPPNSVATCQRCGSGMFRSACRLPSCRNINMELLVWRFRLMENISSVLDTSMTWWSTCGTGRYARDQVCHQLTEMNSCCYETILSHMNMLWMLFMCSYILNETLEWRVALFPQKETIRPLMWKLRRTSWLRLTLTLFGVLTWTPCKRQMKVRGHMMCSVCELNIDTCVVLVWDSARLHWCSYMFWTFCSQSKK